jgi:hypothetical protein
MSGLEIRGMRDPNGPRLEIDSGCNWLWYIPAYLNATAF